MFPSDGAGVSADLLRFGGTRGESSPTEDGIDVQGLFRAHWRDLVRLGCLLLDDRPAAEDAVQEAFLSLHRNASRIREPAAALSYLRASVVNRTRSAHRRRYRARRTIVPPEVTVIAAADESALLSAEHRPVIDALARLSRRQREVLVLRYYLDLSEQQIAERLGIGAGTVKKAASRGLATLALRVEEVRS